MNCIEHISNIVRIETYPLGDISVSIPYTISPKVPASAVTITGTPVAVLLKQDDSAEANCALVRDAGGPLFSNSLSWQADGDSQGVLQQINDLTAGSYHYIIYTYDGTRKLLYNWCGLGKATYENRMTGGDESLSVSFSIKSRYPILTIL